MNLQPAVSRFQRAWRMALCPLRSVDKVLLEDSTEDNPHLHRSRPFIMTLTWKIKLKLVFLGLASSYVAWQLSMNTAAICDLQVLPWMSELPWSNHAIIFVSHCLTPEKLWLQELDSNIHWVHMTSGRQSLQDCCTLGLWLGLPWLDLLPGGSFSRFAFRGLNLNPSSSDLSFLEATSVNCTFRCSPNGVTWLWSESLLRVFSETFVSFGIVVAVSLVLVFWCCMRSGESSVLALSVEASMMLGCLAHEVSLILRTPILSINATSSCRASKCYEEEEENNIRE